MNDDGELYKQLKDFTTQDWQDWAEDILCFNMAYPFSRIKAESDVLMDVVGLLHEQKLPVRYYSEAVVNLLNEYYGRKEHPDRVVRLLNALIVLKTARALALLKRMLFDKNMDLWAYGDDSIKARVLQAITQIDLEPEILADVDAYMKDAGPRLFPQNMALAGSYLRFSLSCKTETDFFADLTEVIVILDKKMSKDLMPFAVTTMEDKLRAFYFKYGHVFYSRFYQWLTEIAKIYEENALLQAILVKFSETLKQRYPLYRETFHTEQDVAEVVMTVMNLLTSPGFIEKCSLPEMKKMAEFLFERDSERLMNLIAWRNSTFILAHFDSNDYSLNSHIANSHFLFRGKTLSIDSYRYLIYLLQRAELIMRRQPKDKSGKSRLEFLQLKEEVISGEEFD